VLVKIGNQFHCQQGGDDFVDGGQSFNGATKKEVAEAHGLDNRIGKSFGRFWAPN
jgi:hypothetical protein